MQASEATLAPNHPPDLTTFTVFHPGAMSTVADAREMA
jgi:hypothetical protein